MNFNNSVPLFICHFLEWTIRKYTCIVNQNIYFSLSIDSCLNDFISFKYVVLVSYSISTIFLNKSHNFIHTFIFENTIDNSSQIIYNNIRFPLCKF